MKETLKNILILLLILIAIIGYVYLEHYIKDNNINLKTKTIDLDETINKINIDINVTNLKIMKSDSFKAETNNKKISFNYKNNELIIKEPEELFKQRNHYELVLYLPSNITLEELNLEADVSDVNIQDLFLNNLFIDISVGQLIANNITSINSCEIEGGVGKIEIENSRFKRIDLDLGVGRTSFKGTISDEANIETGVGDYEMTLTNGLDNYSIYTKKGLGSVIIGEETDVNERTIGVGKTKIDLETGIGSVTIK